MPLARRSDLKTRFGVTDSVADGRFDAALEAATRMIERWCDRSLLYAAADLTEQLDGGEFRIRVRRWPIVKLTSVKEAADYSFASATALTSNQDMFINTARGWIERLPIGTRWLDGPGVVQVVYRGGYIAPDDDAIYTDPVSFVPEHIQQACLLQAADMYRRQDEPGYKVVFGGGGGAAGVTGGFAPEIKMLAAVQELLRGERRF